MTRIMRQMQMRCGMRMHKAESRVRWLPEKKTWPNGHDPKGETNGERTTQAVQVGDGVAPLTEHQHRSDSGHWSTGALEFGSTRQHQLPSVSAESIHTRNQRQKLYSTQQATTSKQGGSFPSPRLAGLSSFGLFLTSSLVPLFSSFPSSLPSGVRT